MRNNKFWFVLPHLKRINKNSKIKLTIAVFVCVLLLFLIFFILNNKEDLSLRTLKPTFRAYLVADPQNLSPFVQKSPFAGHLFTQLYSPLLKYQNGKLKAGLAETCFFVQKQHIRCLLRKNIFWSDGSPIVAEDFLRTFQTFLDPEKPGLRADLLMNIRNAGLILNKNLSISELGIRVVGANQLDFYLEKIQSDYLYQMALPLFVPTHPQKKEMIFSGPYQISQWIPQRKITLTPNPYFRTFREKIKDHESLNDSDLNHPVVEDQRPIVEFLIVADEGLAYKLYEKGEINFMRRIPTQWIPSFKNRNDFYSIPQLRFDYWGFGPLFKNKIELRKMLSLSLDFHELQELFHSVGRPGCTGLPPDEIDENICINYNLSEAQKLMQKLIKENLKIPSFSFSFSSQGGEDHKLGSDWIQSQWGKNLGIIPEIHSLEGKIFMKDLSDHKFSFFRKGLTPNRPTCLAILENFHSRSPENYIEFKSQELDSIIDKLSSDDENHKKDKKSLCRQGISLLMNSFSLIPTGPYHFSTLASENFIGWHINEFGVLDLSELRSSN